MPQGKTFDAVVVGAGPAGAAAALAMAQKGLKVLLLERGDVPGAKNMYGGMVRSCPVVNDLIPDFWDQAPWERHVVKRTLTLMGDGKSTSLVFETESFDHPPYNGYTLFRPIFDRWLAERAQGAGARLLCGCRVDDLLWKNGKVGGVRVARAEGEVKAKVVIAADGALSFLAEKAGLRKPPLTSQMAQGIKVLLWLGEEEINERFNLVRDQGATCEIVGCTDGIRGGGFLCTQTETLSAGLVLHLDALKRSGKAPYELLERFLDLEAVRKLIKGAKILEYSAHLLPEGSYKTIPGLFTDGMLVVGDAAGLCYTNGLNQEGMNLALTSGYLAAETALEAFEGGDFSKRQLRQYEERLRGSFVLKDMRTFQGAVDLMHDDRLFSTYPQVIGTIMEEIFRSDGAPKMSIGRVARQALRQALSTRDLMADLIKATRSLI